MTFIRIFVALILVSCGHNSANKDKSLMEENLPLTSTLRASRYSNIYFSGQPQLSEWDEIKEQGFTHIINLRQSTEYDEMAERKKVEAQGMIYTQFPMNPQEKLMPQQVELISHAVEVHQDKGKTLVHCGSGARAAYWAGADFYLNKNYSKEKAMDLAQKMGLRNQSLQAKLQTFFSENPQ